jgi:hypothetical protein
VAHGEFAKKLAAVRVIARRLIAGLHQLAEPQDPIPGGLRISDWVELWGLCHEYDEVGNVKRREWPEAGSLIEQPSMTVTMFQEIGHQHYLHRQQVQQQREAARR